MGDQQLRRLCQRFELKTYRHHDIIVSLEDNKNVSDDFYVVYKGSALMKYGDELIETKSVGNCFGNAALMIDKIPNKEHEYVAQEGDEGMLSKDEVEAAIEGLIAELELDLGGGAPAGGEELEELPSRKALPFLFKAWTEGTVTGLCGSYAYTSWHPNREQLLDNF